jgi:phospholipid/cholesterol/gamma-HCH transport system permease protein
MQVGQTRTFSDIGNWLVKFFEWFGNLALFCGRLIRSAVAPPYEIREFFHQFDELGSKSLPLVALAGAATGIVPYALDSGQPDPLRSEVISSRRRHFSMIKESGPIITALVVSGRAAAGIGAELGAMKVTEQVDAMEASAVNPYKFLIATRVLACMLMLPLLTLVTDFFGILMGWVANTARRADLASAVYPCRFQECDLQRFSSATLKTMVFGLLIGVISCFQGMNARGGTQGVERAATELRSSGLAVHHPGGCAAGPSDPSIFSLRAAYAEQRCRSELQESHATCAGGIAQQVLRQAVVLKGISLEVGRGEQCRYSAAAARARAYC